MRIVSKNTKPTVPASKSLLNPIEQAMEQRHSWGLAARLKLLKICEKLPNLTVEPPKQVLTKKPIWQFWHSGVEHAPLQLKPCLKSVEKWVPDGFTLIRLSETSLADYINIPSIIRKKRHLITNAHFSDIVRTLLLYQYGGIWMDASIFLSGSIPQNILNADFFVFKYHKSGPMLSSWFITVQQPQNILIGQVAAALLKYWHLNNSLINYFTIHHLFECIILKDPQSKAIFDNAPTYLSPPAHSLQNLLSTPYNQKKVQEIFSRKPPIHKLTHKIQVVDDTTLDFLIKNLS